MKLVRIIAVVTAFIVLSGIVSQSPLADVPQAQQSADFKSIIKETLEGYVGKEIMVFAFPNYYIEGVLKEVGADYFVIDKKKARVTILLQSVLWMENEGDKLRLRVIL